MARFSKQKQFVTIYLKCALLVPENVCFYMLCLLAISNLIHQYLISITYHRRHYFFIKQSHALKLGLPTDTYVFFAPQKQNHTRVHIMLPPSLLTDKTQSARIWLPHGKKAASPPAGPRRRRPEPGLGTPPPAPTKRILASSSPHP